MKYRTRKELARLSLAEVLAELDRLKIEPAEQTVYALDAGYDADGVPILGDPPAYLSESQQRACRANGSTLLTLQQQVEQGMTLEQWRHQLYSHGVETSVSSLGLKKCLAQLKVRKQEMSTWEQRMATRRDVEKRLICAIHTETEKEQESEA